MKKLLLVGTNTIHTYIYYDLVKEYFDEIVLITNETREGYSINTHLVDFSLSPKSILIGTRKIKQVIEEFQPTIIHIHQANSVAFYVNLALTGINIPTVLTTWGSDILVAPHVNRLLRWMVRYNLKKATALTADSLYVVDAMKKLQNDLSPITVANFGIGFEPPQTIIKEKIIYSNRLHKPLYRIKEIIYAFRKFKDSIDDKEWKLVIAATGDQTDELKQLVKDLHCDDITFIGWVDAQTNAAYYTKATYWVSIPTSDATSISLLEAMACGCIPILSDLPANHEWIKHKETGIIVKDIESNFFLEAYHLSMEAAIKKNQEKIQKEGTKAANRQKFISIYEQLV